MIDHLLEWLSLVVRWIHVITGVAWIGASFYFNWLDTNLREPERDKPLIKGELWAVHGGGFYEVQKYKVAPEELPKTLHWFKYEAYFTWLSGFFLLCLVYYAGAEVFLIDPGVMALSKASAISIGLSALVVGWLVYDGLCRSPLAERPVAFGAVLFTFMTAAAWGLSEVFSPQGAYIHVGAMIGTMMAANVFFVIIPGQKQLVVAKKEGREPDPVFGLRGRARREAANGLGYLGRRLKTRWRVHSHVARSQLLVLVA